MVKYVVSRIVVAPGRLASWTTITANTIDASPRGPNQPRNATVRQLADVPSIAIATGSIRTMVRLSTAYSTISQVTCSSAGPRRTAPNTRNVTPPNSAPTSSLNRDASSDSPDAIAPKTAPPTN